MPVEIKTQVQALGVLTALRGRSLKGFKNVSIGVIYDAHYGVIVHENPRPVSSRNITGGPGQHKYLEGPARDPKVHLMMNQLINQALRRKRSLEDAVIDAAGYLLKESQKIVPVITQYLRDSGHLVKLPAGPYQGPGGV